jgi:bis(5'-nucleosyl)-tetraphosphatase (symmetrical)
VLAARDAGELVDWVRTRPMMHVEGRYAMVHAGLVPQWTLEKAAALAREVEQALAAPGHRDFLAHMYGSEPVRWSDSLAGWDRLRVIVNAMTRLRFCAPDGTMEFRAKGSRPPAGFLPWFETRKSDEATILFGHWSALGLKVGQGVVGLDSGCIWGGALTAMRLEDRALFQVECAGYQEAKGDE